MSVPGAVGLDIGGTKLHAVLVGPDGAVSTRATAPTPAQDGPDAVLDAVADLARGLGELPAHVGVGSAGQVDRAGTVVSATDALPGWPGTDLVGGLRRRLGAGSVAVLNDVDAFALAETTAGAAAGSADVLAVMVGTGVGAGAVVDGRLVVGAHAAALNLGHVSDAEAADLPCGCGARGHVESVASGTGMLARYRGAGGAAADLRDVAARAAAGEPLARTVLAAAGASLGRVLAGAVTLLDPAVVVLGGGALAVGEAFLGPLRVALDASVLPVLAPVDLRRSVLGADAVAVGAARAALGAA